MTWPTPDFEHLLLSSHAMQQLEAALFAQGLPVAALLEQAGLGLAQAVLQHTDLKRHGLLHQCRHWQPLSKEGCLQLLHGAAAEQ